MFTCDNIYSSNLHIIFFNLNEYNTNDKQNHAPNAYFDKYVSSVMLEVKIFENPKNLLNNRKTRTPNKTKSAKFTY